MTSTKITKRKRRIEAVARLLIQQNQMTDEDIAKQLHAPLEDILRWRISLKENHERQRP